MGEHVHSAKIIPSIREDAACLATFNSAAWDAIAAYINNPDHPPHLPPALLFHVERTAVALDKAADVKAPLSPGMVQRDILAQLLVTGMLLGAHGITLDALTACDCHEHMVTDDMIKALLDQFSPEEGKSDGNG